MSPLNQDEPPELGDALAIDLPCRRCGYNLRGLGLHGRCPECRTPVQRSLAGDLLKHSDPAWVRQLAGGMWWLNAAIIIGVCLIIAGVPLPRIGWQAVGFALTVVSGGLAMAGVWRVTAPDPAATEKGLLTTRFMLRSLLASAVALELLRRLPVPALGRAGEELLILTTAVWIAGFFAFFRHLRGLALRIPDAKLAAETTAVLWGTTAFCFMLAGLAFAAMSPGSLPGPLRWVFALSCTVIVGCVFFGLWALILISRYARALRTEAIEADAVASYDEAA